MRVALDIKALELKNVLEHGREHFDRLQPILTDFLSALIHRGAITVAKGARIAETRAYKLADLVSHKQGFVQRQTQSEYLQQVTDHKNGSNSDLDLDV